MKLAVKEDKHLSCLPHPVREHWQLLYSFCPALCVPPNTTISDIYPAAQRCASPWTWISIALRRVHARSATSPSDPFSRFCGPCYAVSLHPVTRSKRRREKRRNLVVSPCHHQADQRRILPELRCMFQDPAIVLGCREAPLAPPFTGRPIISTRWRVLDAEGTRDDHMGIAALITVATIMSMWGWRGYILWFRSAHGETLILIGQSWGYSDERHVASLDGR